MRGLGSLLSGLLKKVLGTSYGATGAKAQYTQTRAPGGTAAYNWANEGNCIVEDGIYASCQSGVDDTCVGAYSARLAGRLFSWNIPPLATITALKIRYKIWEFYGTHLYRLRASWNDGTNWTTVQQGTFPASNSWVEYDATQGHPNWTVAELNNLRAQICSVNGSPASPDYCDAIQAVVTYEVDA